MEYIQEETPKRSGGKKQKSRLKERLNNKLVRIACQTFTIRGMGKLNHGPQFLRILWLFFIFIMTVGLIVATILIVLEYLQYDTNINISIDKESNDPFPALTICHQHPFSSRAYQLWDQGEVLSPTQFSNIIRRSAHEKLSKGNRNVNLAEQINQFDVISLYYQNLKEHQAESIGFNTSIFLNCMYNIDSEVAFEDDCTKLELFNVKRLSHHIYFNCHTFEPKNLAVSSRISQLGLIVSLGPEPDYEKNEQAFFLDLFNMAKGLRVIVHPSGTFPNIEEDSVNVEPGKMNEINFQHVQWENLDTPTNRCVKKNETMFEQDEEKTKLLRELSGDLKYAYYELDQPYTYTEKQCDSYFQQKQIIEKCNCQYVFFPRIEPIEKVPYCANFLDKGKPEDVIVAANCLQTIEAIEKSKFCKRECTMSEYEWTTSVTKWRAVEWQLHWLRQLNKAFKQMKDETTSEMAYKKWTEFYENGDLTKIPDQKSHKLNLKGENFAYVILKRKPGGKIIKREKLTLSIYVLFSRIGGLCSLTIGLTTAFFIEIIEFVYLIYYQRNRKTSRSQNQTTIQSAHI